MDNAVPNRPLMPEAPQSSGQMWLRAFVICVGACGVLFLAALYWYITLHADPNGDGMEFAALPAAIGLIFLPLSMPALILGAINRLLAIGAFFAVLSIIAYAWFGMQIAGEIGWH